MLTAVFQSMIPELDVSFPHTQVEEFQSISLEVLESDPLHDFLQAVYIEGSRTNVTMAKFILGTKYSPYMRQINRLGINSVFTCR